MQPVAFQGFAGDCTVTGKITMFGERLTDFLNGQERFRLHKVQFQSLDDGHIVAEDSVSLVRDDLLAVDVALEELAALDARKAQVVELRFFGGLSVEEIARTLGVSPRTVHGDWTFARAWLYRKLSDANVH